MKSQNLQRGFAPLLVIAIVAVLAIGGGVYVSKKNAAKNAELEDNLETQANANADANANANANLGINASANAKGSLRSLLGLAKNQMCTFTSTAGGLDSIGTVYVSSTGEMRGDFKTETSTSSTVESHMIVKGGTSYVWSGTQGAKMDVSATNSTAAGAKQSVDMDSQVDYKCSDWTVDSSKFTLPTGINFIDLKALMNVDGKGSIKIP